MKKSGPLSIGRIHCGADPATARAASARRIFALPT
jgi:hypothetical protein